MAVHVLADVSHSSQVIVYGQLVLRLELVRAVFVLLKTSKAVAASRLYV